MEEKLTKVNYFTNFDLAKFINAINVNTYLQRYREKHLIFRIKQGIYVSKERLEYFEKV